METDVVRMPGDGAPSMQIRVGSGPTVEFRSTARGWAVSSTGLGVLLEYARPRSVRRVIARHAPKALRAHGEWFLVRADVTEVLKHSRTDPQAVAQLGAYFEAAESTPSAQVPSVPSTVPAVVVLGDAPLTAREQLQLGQVRVEQARFITGLITARRLAKELTPQEHRRLAHKAAEIALGEPIYLEERTVPTVVAPPAAPVLPVIAAEGRPSLGAVVRGAQLGTPSPVAPRAAEAPKAPSAVPTGDPFNFDVSTVPAAPAAPPKDARSWIVSRCNPANRSTASELAYLAGFGCTRQKIGTEASRLGFKEGHPWVETKQVQGRHSNRQDCTIYYYNYDASLALIEAVLTYPTKGMRRRMLAARNVPLDLFKAQVVAA